MGLLDVLHFLLHLYKRHGKLLSFQGFQVCNRVRIPDVSLESTIEMIVLFLYLKKVKTKMYCRSKKTTSAYIYITYVVVGSAQSRYFLWRIAGGSL